MTRNEAKEILARHDLVQLPIQAREVLLLDWWSIDADDPEYDELPETLKMELASADGPDDPMASRYEPLLQIALRRSFVGVVNSFLERRVRELGHETRVEGAVEQLAVCPCCGYRSLRERGGYEICRVCFWEDDGANELDCVSGPNHMTLREARENFKRLGAVTIGARKHVLPDGQERYARAED